MQVKSNLRAGQGGSTSTDTSVVSGKGGANKGGASDPVPAPAPVVYYPVSRCVGY